MATTGADDQDDQDVPHRLAFYLNDRKIEIDNPDPGSLLVDWLRSPEIGMTGTKKSCGQGGCGACTVMLSEWDEFNAEVTHRAINACMKPLASLDGKQITTVEGLGSVESGMSPVQYRLALQNGSQCGFCSPGWVMAMHSHLVQSGENPGTVGEIEQLFDGNICRCTGYRSILQAMTSFAVNYERDTDITFMAPPGITDPGTKIITPEFPDQLRTATRPVMYRGPGHKWFRPVDEQSLAELWQTLGGFDDTTKLVFGNTSSGVYNRHIEDPVNLIDISAISGLDTFNFAAGTLTLGGCLTYSKLLDHLIALQQSSEERYRPALDSLHYMAHRTAGMIVRNAASLAGNTQLVARHVHTEDIPPFPSDLFSAMVCLDARVELLEFPGLTRRSMDLLEYANAWGTDETLQTATMIVAYEMSLPEATIMQCFKTALRDVNSHTIVNAAFRFDLDDGGVIRDCRVVYAGLGAVAFRSFGLEDFFKGTRPAPDMLPAAVRILTDEADRKLNEFRARAHRLPDEGFSEDYLKSLALGYLYKMVIRLLESGGSVNLPTDILQIWQPRQTPIKTGRRRYEHDTSHKPVGEPRIGPYSFLQTTGEARYTHDLDASHRGVQAVMAISEFARATVCYQVPVNGQMTPCSIPDLVTHLSETFPDFVDYVTCLDVPTGGDINFRIGEIHDPVVLVMDYVNGVHTGDVFWHGQPLGIVCATDLVSAEIIAHYAQSQCVYYERHPHEICLTIEEAEEQESFFEDSPHDVYPVHIETVTRPGSDLDWVNQHGETLLDDVSCNVVHGEQSTGAQIHFYMETQSCLAEPLENGEMIVHPSSQSPDSVQAKVARALGLSSNQVTVRTRRLGGAYGGKTSRSPYAAVPAALAAHKLGRPVLFQLPRETDTPMFGHRHPLHGRFSLAIGNGLDDEANKGVITGWQVDFTLDGGWTYDCSFVVSDCIQLRADNAYMVPNYRSLSNVARTNKTSNTAFRTFGLIQAVAVQEEALDLAALSVGMLAEDVREKNLYRQYDLTPYGQKLEYCYVREVWSYARARSGFDQRLEEINEFNARHRWRKRGIALVPVQYGSGYNLTSLEQGGAYVEVFSSDGTVMLRHGGIEMGQGMSVKILQIAASTLNIPIGMIRMGETDTSVIPNPSSTGASTGTAYNGGAVKSACEMLRARIEKYCESLDDATRAEKHIDLSAYRTNPGDSNGEVWSRIIKTAFNDRVNLSAQVRFKQSGGLEHDANLGFTHAAEEADQFSGYTYNVGCSEVEVDLMSGECAVRRADIFYDVGHSLNPAIDIGQVEGAFVQGIGMILTEKVVHQQTGENRGRLNTVNTWRYKPPTYTTIPDDFRVELFPRGSVDWVEENRNDLLSSKEVGEPPMVLAVSVHRALKQAIRASRKQRNLSERFDLPLPATVQEIREAALIIPEDLEI